MNPLLTPLRVAPLTLLLELPAAMIATGTIWLVARQHALPLWQHWSRRPTPAHQR